MTPDNYDTLPRDQFIAGLDDNFRCRVLIADLTFSPAAVTAATRISCICRAQRRPSLLLRVKTVRVGRETDIAFLTVFPPKGVWETGPRQAVTAAFCPCFLIFVETKKENKNLVSSRSVAVLAEMIENLRSQPTTYPRPHVPTLTKINIDFQLSF